MKNLADIEFDHEASHIKHREFGRGVTYTQRGVLFNSGFQAIKILEEISDDDEDIDNMSVAEMRAMLKRQKSTVRETKSAITAEKKTKKKSKSSVRQRADSKLKGFKEEENPDFIREALHENIKAKRAEENAV